MLHFFKQKGTRLGRENIPLGDLVSGYRFSSPLCIGKEDVMYIGSIHEVTCRVLIPDGPQGFFNIAIPCSIKTQDALLEYLEQFHGFCLKK